jgi:hypothetical protein
MMATSGFLGGLLGGAEKNLKGRKSRLDQAEEEAMGAPKEQPKEEKPAPRPPQSKKWYE